MLHRLLFLSHTLRARLVLSFVAILAATLLMVGVPALWLVRAEMERLAQAPDQIAAAQERIAAALGASAVITALLATGLAVILARRMATPLVELAAASEGIGRGDLYTPIPTHQGLAEMQTFARTLDRMRDRLQSAYVELEHSKVWSENLLASLVEGVVTVDGEGIVTYYSPGAEHILGWRATDVVGRPLGSFLQSPDSTAGVLLAYTPAAPGTVERRLVRTRTGESAALQITFGKRTERAGAAPEQPLVLRDVTHEEQALRLREFFLANISHELKTPLAALRASVELLASDAPTLTHAEQAELVESLWLGVLRLEEQIENLLSSASMGSGHFQVRLSATDFQSVLKEAVLTTRPQLKLRGQTLEIEAPLRLPPVQGDARRLRQVLLNLVSNAAKYGPSDTPILLRVRVLPALLRIEVQDRGPGIPPEFAPSLFKPFQAGSDHARGGVGLGLAIVNEIVRRHGGEVGVEQSAAGTCFWFTLLLAPQREIAAAEEGTSR